MSPVRSTDKKVRDKAATKARQDHVRRMVKSLLFYAAEEPAGDGRDCLNQAIAYLYGWLPYEEKEDLL